MRAERLLLLAALAAGVAARAVLTFARPLWADEVFTLTLVRLGPSGILEALRADSGPPLHYLVSWLVLLPATAPSGWDLAVRGVSVLASLLHLPLLVRLGTRLRPEDPAAGFRAAALFAVFPLAILYAAEGRAYALASLLVLVAFDRALALREEPTLARGAALAAAAAAAALSHYLAVVVLAGFPVLLLRAGKRERRALLFAFGGAALVAAAWLPVAFAQPRAAMAWAEARPVADGARHVAIGLLGQRVYDAALGRAFPIALVLLTAVGVATRRTAPRAAAATLGLGLAVLISLGAVGFLPALPERSAVLFLPFVALIAGSRRLAAAPLLLVCALAVPGLLREETAPTPAQRTAELLLGTLAPGERVVAVGPWGPELAYRFARAGRTGSVVFFPSDVSRHPGWYEEAEAALGKERLEAEAHAAAAGKDAPRWWLLPRGSRASAALEGALGSGAAVAAQTPYWTLRRRQAIAINP